MPEPSSPAVKISRCRRDMKLEWPMLTSTEPWDEFRPIVTDLFFMRYSNSRPSSRAIADPNIPLTTAIFQSKVSGADFDVWKEQEFSDKCDQLKGFVFWPGLIRRGVKFYTVEDLARNVPDRGTQPLRPTTVKRKAGSERDADQSKADKRTEVLQ